MEKHKIVMISLAFVGIIAVAGFYLIPFKGELVDIRKFTGSVSNIEGNKITVRGVFDGPQGAIPEELSSVREFYFIVDEKTAFQKLVTQLPSWEELMATGATSGTYELKDRPRTEGKGSLDDLGSHLIFDDNGATGNVLIEVDFPISIYGAENPVASSVFYQVMLQQ